MLKAGQKQAIIDVRAIAQIATGRYDREEIFA
jgi:hypothetical protein